MATHSSILAWRILAGYNSWGRKESEAETPILWPPDGKNCLIGKDPDVGKVWKQEEKGRTEDDEMVGRHRQLSGHEFEWTPGAGDEQGGLACCSPWGCKESDTTERLSTAQPTNEASFRERSVGTYREWYPGGIKLKKKKASSKIMLPFL